jgi:hypothetical protein
LRQSTRSGFSTQSEKLRALLFARISQWIPLPDIQALGIAQHGARIAELREELEPQGCRIENRLEDGSDGIKRSWYMLTAGQPPREYVPRRRNERTAPPPTPEHEPVEPGQDWYKVQTGPRTFQATILAARVWYAFPSGAPVRREYPSAAAPGGAP